MKRILLLALLSLGALVGCQETRLTVGSYNVRYDAAADATNGDSWAERKEAVAEIILQHDFDIVGTQEANARQLPELEALLEGYGCIYHPYGGNNGTGHNCATFYKLEKFDLLDQGTFWYSPTPEVKSIGWDATDYRLCHWGKFREKQSGKEFYFFNSHLYWRLHEAREKSGGVHISMVKKIAGDSPVVSVGDFNSTEGTPQVQEILWLQNLYPHGNGFPIGNMAKTYGNALFTTILSVGKMIILKFGNILTPTRSAGRKIAFTRRKPYEMPLL